MLGEWIKTQSGRSADWMEKAISATHLRKNRKVFGYSVSPVRGSVLASPVMASWDPDPDYFFHWIRDSALIMDAAVHLATTDDKWVRHIEDFISFSLSLGTLRGQDFLDKNNIASHTDPAFLQYLRPDADIRALEGDALPGEPRFNPDGTIDFLQWSRPQYDGPALRALMCLRYHDFCRARGRRDSADLMALLRRDLDFTARYADKPCIGPWEEEHDQHYYTVVVQMGALKKGIIHAEAQGDHPAARQYAEAALMIEKNLERHWVPEHGLYKSSRHKNFSAPAEALDIAEIMGVVHAGLSTGRHSVQDERVQSTLAHLEEMFQCDYPINHARPKDAGLAFGRYRGDKYFSGGAYYFSTLAVAEFYYRLGLVARGDAVMRMVQMHTPEDGALSEQFDKATGEQTSARHLTWSYAAFITAAEARRNAISSA